MSKYSQLTEEQKEKQREQCRLWASRNDRTEYRKAYYEANKDRLKSLKNEYMKKLKRTNPGLYLFNKARNRARERGLAFDITPHDVVVPEACPYLGIPLYTDLCKQSDNSPTLDRIDSSKGYVRNNVEVISMRANRIKNDATGEELLRMAERLLSLY